MRLRVRIGPGYQPTSHLAPVVIIGTNGYDERSLSLSLNRIAARFGYVDGSALDLMLIASVCYVLDKTVPRARNPESFDGWARVFDTDIPVSDPDLWTNQASELQAILHFLTGDEWRFRFSGRPAPIYLPPSRKRRSANNNQIQPDAVCLFSGGLDSLAGAINLLSSDTDRKVLLIGHYDSSGPRSDQRRLRDAIAKYYTGRTELHNVRIAHTPAKAAETTLRSRSFAFLAMAYYISQSIGETVPIYAPENGFIAINVPLTPSRVGSCSTRTMHPFFLNGLRRLASRIGLRNSLQTPFEFTPKGACLAECKAPEILGSVASMSVSCAHPNRHRYWYRRPPHARNCGYCVPCLIRRAAMFHVGLDAGKQYGIDVFRETEIDISDDLKASDLRALVSMLNRKPTISDLRREILSISPLTDANAYAALVQQGLEEVRSLFLAGAKNAAGRARLGLK